MLVAIGTTLAAPFIYSPRNDITSAESPRSTTAITDDIANTAVDCTDTLLVE